MEVSRTGETAAAAAGLGKETARKTETEIPLVEFHVGLADAGR